MKLKIGAVLTTAITTFSVQAQTDSTKTANPLKISGYIETYYAYDFGQPETNTRPNFTYSHNRHNEVALNLGFVKATYEKDNVRANIALMAGTYSNANLAAEEGVLKNIYEANAGIKLSETKNLWVDAGIFASHIGFESAISADCWTLTRSLLAENSPYYETGLKLTYLNKSEKLMLSAMFLNGWQRIQKPNYIQKPSFGLQITYRPIEKITLNYSNFIGTDKPDSINALRHFHNIYMQCINVI